MCVWFGMRVPTSHEEGKAASDEGEEAPPSPPGSGAGPLAGSLKKAVLSGPPLSLSRKALWRDTRLGFSLGLSGA